MRSGWTSPVRVAVLGAVRITAEDGRALEPAGRLGRALIIALSLGPSRGSVAPVSETALIDDIWGDQPPAGARQALQTLVSRTRAMLPDDMIVRRGQGYALSLSQDDIDLGRARILAQEVRECLSAGDHARASDLAGGALALWSGEPGADASGAPAAHDLAAAAALVHDELHMAQAEALLEAGDADAAVQAWQRLRAARPLDEHRAASLMRALDAAGRRTDALAVFAATRAALRDELGISPGPVLIASNARLLHELPEPSAAWHVASLPASPNELIGREADVAAVQKLLSARRVVTILGTGGLGKTRLALEVARHSPIGAVFVELAGVRSPDDLMLAVASALGVRDVAAPRTLAEPRGDDRGRIVGALREHRTLLVVDNCEHVVGAAAAWIADLLAEVEGLRILTTSRTPLEIGAEQVYALEPLASAGRGDTVAPAVALFVERAQASRPSAALPLEVVTRLCSRLDGLPLAIELAAARVRTMSVEQIETRLTRRFALLTAGDRSAPDRHRTLRAVVEWSWDLLDAPARELFCRLCVFPDGFSTSASEHVGSGLRAASAGVEEVFESLDALVTQSLVLARDLPDGTVRFRMLETIREFGLEQLSIAGRGDEATGRMVGWADDTARALLRLWSGPRQPEVIRTTRIEQENLTFALRAALARADPAASAGIFALVACILSVTDGHADVATFGPLVESVTLGWVPDDEHALAAAVGMLIAAVTSGMTNAPRVAWRARVRLRKWERAGIPLPRAIEAAVHVVTTVRTPEEFPLLLAGLAGDPDPATALLGGLMSGQMAENNGENEHARASYLTAWTLAQARGDTWAAAMCAGSLATLSVQGGDAPGALQWVDAASTGMSALGIGSAFSDWNRALVFIALDRRDEARETLERLRDSPEAAAPDTEFLAIAHLGLAELARLDGHPDASFAEYAVARSSLSDGGFPNPWQLMILSWGVMAGVQDGVLADDVLRADEDALRRQAVELGRLRSGLIDLPVLGVAILGIAAGESRSSDGGAARARVGELLALAERVGARADLPLTRISSFTARLEQAGWDFRVARERALAFTRDEAAARAIAMIDERPPLED